jgi:hypothetical protein
MGSEVEGGRLPVSWAHVHYVTISVTKNKKTLHNTRKSVQESRLDVTLDVTRMNGEKT